MFELEPRLIEIRDSKKTNNIISCIFKSPEMNVNEFNDDYLNGLLDKLSKENKKPSLFLIVSKATFLRHFVAHNIFFPIPFIPSPIRMEETSQDLIKKLLFLIIFLLTGNMRCLHLTETFTYNVNFL